MKSIASALAVLAVLSQLTALAHLIAVPHVTCPEHGELVHEEEPVARASAPEGKSSEQLAHSLIAATPFEDQHEHCVSAGVTKDSTVIPRPLPQRIPVPAPLLALSVITSELEPSVPIYRLAPKNSPPA
jgi:hypothetical protein